MGARSTFATRDERADQHDDQGDEPTPACPIAAQCRDTDFRTVASSVVSATFDPCGNAECFPGELEPDADEQVVVARGAGTKSMHKCRDQHGGDA